MKREKYIDILKIILAYCIVLAHVNINSLHSSYGQIGQTHYMVAYTIYQFVYTVVAMFIILTGCGLLSSKHRSCKDMIPRIIKMIICILFWGSCFEAANVLIRHEEMSLSRICADFLNGTTWSHMWFLNKLVVLYLLVPVLGLFIDKCSRIFHYIFTVICLLVISVIPFVLMLFEISINRYFVIEGMFIIYAMIGYLIGTADKNKLKKFALLWLLGAIIGVAAIVNYTVSGKDIIVQIDNPFTVFTAICIVCFTRGIFARFDIDKSVNEKRMTLEELSRCTFGVYIIHPILIHVASIILKINPQLKLPMLCVPLEAVCIFVISMIAVWVYRVVYHFISNTFLSK